MSNTTVRPYESILLFHPNSTEDEQKDIFKKYKALIEGEEGKGKVESVETWGRRALANSIQDNGTAYYFHATFECHPDHIEELERNLKINDKVLRFLHTRLEDGTDLKKYLEQFKTDLRLEKERMEEALKKQK